MGTRPCIVNVGLPRTGTRSFIHAVERLGFRGLHIWHRAEHDPALFDRALRNAPAVAAELRQFDALSDTPFYAMRGASNATIPGRRSSTPRAARTAGCAACWSIVGLAGSSCAPCTGFRRCPIGASTWTLAEAYDRHHASVCEAIPAIDLDASTDRRRWEVLCRGLPRWRLLLERIEGSPWPRVE